MSDYQQTTGSDLRLVAPPEQSHTPVTRVSLGRWLSLRSMRSPTPWAALMAMARQAMQATDDVVYLALVLYLLYRAAAAIGLRRRTAQHEVQPAWTKLVRSAVLAAGIGLAARVFLRILAAGMA